MIYFCYCKKDYKKLELIKTVLLHGNARALMKIAI